MFYFSEKLKLIKLKRKLVHLNEFDSFKSYIESIKDRACFEGTFFFNSLKNYLYFQFFFFPGDDSNAILDNLDIDLLNYYEKYKNYFYLIEPLTVSYQ
jgi:hypothetical protein